MRQVGVPRKVRMRILGHRIRDVHDIYTLHVDPSKLVLAARLLEGLFDRPQMESLGSKGK